ncbi:MAG: RDD family protein [Hydrogenibacillus sp.]|nr:RDD family protein [Hydrogenibacillus sp.]
MALRYAGFWVRLLALLADLTVLSLIPPIVERLLHVAFPLEGLVLSFLLPLAYFVLLTVWFGGTLGKLALGLAVVTPDGGPVRLGRALVRETLGKLVSTLMLGIGFAIAAFDRRKQAIHDSLAGTVVVYRHGSGQKVNTTDRPIAGWPE